MSSPQIAAFLSCITTHLTDEEKYLFSKTHPAGITLFSRNIENYQQLKSLINEIKDTAGESTLIAIDQEGGRVRRLKEPEFIPYASQSQIGALPKSQAKNIAKLHAKLIAYDLKKLGIDINFAPVLDIAHTNTTPALNSRCFSSDKKVISDLGKISIDTYISQGIIPCIKHLPGHGLAISDPHLNLPIINASIKELSEEFYPFQTCNYAPFGMTAHILLNAIDKQHPITQSKKGIKQLIREEIGFDGFLISDAIDMNALSGTISERAEKSLKAGCDCVCYCFGKIEQMQELANTCPKLSNNALSRLDKAKQILHNKAKQATFSQKQKYLSIMNNISAYNEKYDATEVLHQLQRKSQC